MYIYLFFDIWTSITQKRNRDRNRIHKSALRGSENKNIQFDIIRDTYNIIFFVLVNFEEFYYCVFIVFELSYLMYLILEDNKL